MTERIFNLLRSRNLADNKPFNGVLLVVLFTVFLSTYVDAVISPQFGWWHYYAWRMAEGDVLYRDIYLFMPPYFVFITRALYALFGNHLILYTLLVGYPVRVGCLLMIYTVLCRFSKPMYACLAVFFGACLSATYQMDMLYDFNPLTMFPCLLVVYIFVKFYERLKSGRTAYLYSFCIGLLLSLIFCLKQTFGITLSFTVVVMTAVIYFREYEGRRSDFRRYVLLSLAGAFVATLPLTVYLTAYGCWREFFDCIFSVGAAKGGTDKILMRVVQVFSDLRIWSYIVVLIGVWALLRVYYHHHEPRHTEMGMMLSNLVVVSMFAALLADLVAYADLPLKFHSAMTFNSLVVKWRVRVYMLLIDGGFLLWLFKAFRYFTNREQASSILLFTTLIAAHFFTGVLSTDGLEELYLVMYTPWLLVLAFDAKCPYHKLKNAVLLLVVAFFSLTCVSMKLKYPYSWQGWTEASIAPDNIRSQVPGLEGISLPDSVERRFAHIVDLIEENTTSDDRVFQFANIPLFNLLTHRQIPGYVPITWFDVCSDSLAVRVAAELRRHPPKMLVWHNMIPLEWGTVERVFRGGNPSGQRELQRFFECDVPLRYRCLYRLPNGRDGTIEVWLRKDD